MRKNILAFAAIAIMVLFGACSKEEVTEIEPKETERTISLTASMPEDDPATRVTLTPDGLAIKLHWEVGDPIKIIFVQGAKTATQTGATVESISDDRKKAYFTITLPNIHNMDYDKPIDVYGVYGGREIHAANKTIRLPQQDNSQLATLAAIKSDRDVTLYFHKEVSPPNSDVSVNFKHLGSLFCIHLKNSSTLASNPFENFDGARLVGVSGVSDWGYNTGTTAEYFNMETNTFLINQGLTNYIHIGTPVKGLSNGTSRDLWAWFPPLPNKVWPELKLELRAWTGSTVITTSTNSKPAKTPVAGKVYHFYAVWDGTELKFVSKADFEGGDPAQ